MVSYWQGVAPPHALYPWVHIALQPPLVHVAVPFATVGQDMQLEPQCVGSVFVSYWHELGVPHPEYPDAQVVPHAPAVHVAMPFATVGHAAQAAPQKLGFVCVSAQVPPQFVVPPPQVSEHSYPPASPSLQLGVLVPTHDVVQLPHVAGNVMFVPQPIPGVALQSMKAAEHV